MSGNSIVAFQGDTSDQFTFDFHGHQVRGIMHHGEPVFVAGDVAALFGRLTAAEFSRSVDDEDKGVQIVHTPGGPQEMLVLLEPGLYTAVLKSRSKKAKPFQRYVTREVLPSIRKHGVYMSPGTVDQLTDTDTDVLLARAVLVADKKVKELQASNAQLTARVADAEQARAQVEEQRDKLEAKIVDILGRVSGLMLVRHVVHYLIEVGVDCTETSLREWLVEHRWVTRRRVRAGLNGAGEQKYRYEYHPTPRALRNRWLFKQQGETDRPGAGGPPISYVTTKVTHEGFEELLRGFASGRYKLDAAGQGVLTLPAGGLDS